MAVEMFAHLTPLELPYLLLLATTGLVAGISVGIAYYAGRNSVDDSDYEPGVH